MLKPLSRVQQKVFAKLRDYQQRKGQLPELSEFAREFGIHYVSLRQHLEALAKKGYLTFEGRGRGRSPLLELPPALTGVPVLGQIPAGPLSDAFAEAEGFLPLRGYQNSHFALRVQGDSMADLIQDGDIVLFKQQHRPDYAGQICAVRIEGSEVTLKYLEPQESRYLLKPHNPHYPSLEVEADALQIDGVYQGLLRGELVWALLKDSN